MDEIRSNMREARLLRGHGQKVIAHELGVSCATVSDWERGRKSPSVENLKKYCDFLGVSADYILMRTNQPFQGNAASPDWCGDKLERLRLQRGDSPEAAASAIGISVSLYRQYERSLAEPGVSDLIAIARFYKTSVEYLLGLSFEPADESGNIAKTILSISPREMELVEKYRRAEKKDRDSVDYLLRCVELSGKKERRA